MFAFLLIGAASGFPHLNRRNAIDEKSQEDMKIEALFLEADENQDGIATAEEVKAGTEQLGPWLCELDSRCQQDSRNLGATHKHHPVIM